jgi:phosphotransferase system enzyme I (PtsI)
LNSTKGEIVYCGNGVSPGITSGTALKLDSYRRVVLKTLIETDKVDDEVDRFHQAIDASKRQLAALKTRLEEKVGKEHSFILDVHILMLEDQSLLDEIESIIRKCRANAEWAVREATDRIQIAYDSIEDEYFRDRGGDIRNVVERILFNLSGHRPISWKALPENLILVSHDFSPSAFATINLERVRGLALEAGGRTSHSAILARSLGLPAVMEIRDFLQSVTSGDPLLIDGDEGLLVLRPSEDRLARVRELWETRGGGKGVKDPEGATAAPASTKDGVPITLLANIELPHEVRSAKQRGAAGIGLFRSEFLFFAHPRGFPNVNQQLETYSLLAEEMSPHPVAIRTLDTGAEKIGIGQELPDQPNPSMGLRGIRLSLASSSLFAAQVEAILRAHRRGHLEIVLPMVSTLEEIWRVREIVADICGQIYGGNAKPERPIAIGAMIEIPAAVLDLDSLVQELDFLCVGTNDLIQYLLAVDRDNPQVSYLYQPLHPAVLQCLYRIAEISKKHRKVARVCGEFSANPFFAVLLIGMGYTSFSMNPLSIGVIRKLLARLTLGDARSVAERALSLRTAEKIADFITKAVPRIVGMDLSRYVKELRVREGFSYSIDGEAELRFGESSPPIRAQPTPFAQDD